MNSDDSFTECSNETLELIAKHSRFVIGESKLENFSASYIQLSKLINK